MSNWYLEDVASVMAEKMAAMLFIVGGEPMVSHGLIEFGERGVWLTQKGQQFYQNVLARLPDPTVTA